MVAPHFGQSSSQPQDHSSSQEYPLSIHDENADRGRRILILDKAAGGTGWSQLLTMLSQVQGRRAEGAVAESIRPLAFLFIVSVDPFNLQAPPPWQQLPL